MDKFTTIFTSQEGFGEIKIESNGQVEEQLPTQFGGGYLGMAGRTVTFTAYPQSGWKFVKWEIVGSEPFPPDTSCTEQDVVLLAGRTCCAGLEPRVDPLTGITFCRNPVGNPQPTPTARPASDGGTSFFCSEPGEICLNGSDCCSGLCSNVICGGSVGKCINSAVEANCGDRTVLGEE